MLGFVGQRNEHFIRPSTSENQAKTLDSNADNNINWLEQGKAVAQALHGTNQLFLIVPHLDRMFLLVCCQMFEHKYFAIVHFSKLSFYVN